MGDGGFADQGANVAVLCNEESVQRVRMRYINAATGRTGKEILDDVDSNLMVYR